jgi:hypothetical protein
MSNKKSCDLVQSGVAGPSTERIMDSIRTEFWLPAKPRRASPKNATDDAQTNRTSTIETKEVKP